MQKSSPIKLSFLLTLVLMLASAFSYSCAQTNRAALSGTIEDATGAKLPNAQVVITNIDTKISRTVIANADGNYNAPALAPGNYVVKVSAAGFSGETRKGVVLTVGVAALINFNLKVGGVSAEVVVTENPSSVDVTTSQISGAVSGHEMRELPLNGRSWTDLAALSPGVTVIKTQPPVSAPDRMKRGLGGELSIAGGRPQQNSYLLDGININDYSNAGPGSVLGGNIGVDALQEFTVVTTNPAAQYGRTAAGVISAVTRSGTNAIHGSAYEFTRNAALDARNYFDPVQKPDFTRNQFGASLGGPIQKDKTFLFGDYEGVRQNLGVSYIDTVPSAAARSGLLCVPSADGTDPCASQMQNPGGVDPAAAAFLNTFIPLPNAGSSGDTGTFTFPAYQVTSENFFTVKLDHTFSEKDSAAVVYMYDNSPSQQPDAFNNVLTLSKTIRQTVSILETHIASSTTVNTFHAGFNRDNAGSPYAATAIKPAANDPQFGFQPGDSAGIVQIGGLTTFTGGVTAANPLLFHWNSFQGYDDLSHTAGKNNLAFGVSIERIQDNQKSSDAPGGNFSFASLSDFINNKPQSFITTLPSTLSPRNLRQTIFGAYVLDDLRVTPNFTANLGLRYEIASVPYEINGKLSNLRELAGNTPFTGNPYIKNPTFKNFEPRVGFAWDPFKKGDTSVRAAFGIYDVLPYIVEMGSGVDAAYPFAQDASTSALPQGSFPNGAYLQVANDLTSRNYYVLQYNPPRNYIMMWNLNVQRALTKNTTLLVGYVGSRGVHNWYQTDDGNIVLPTTPDGKSYFWPTDPNAQVVDPLVGQTLDARWNGNSYFHGLETQITQAPWHGLQGQLSYTYSRCIDTSSGSAASDQYRNSLNVDLYTAPATHRGPCDTNIGQNLSINSIYNLPGTSLHGFAGWATNGWQTGGIFTAASGSPFSVTITGDPLGTKAAIPFDFPDRLKTPGCSKLTTGNPNAYINLKCFAFPNPVNRMGNAGRNELTGPRSINLDLSFYKNTAMNWIDKGANLQLRAEIFNSLNHTDFAAPTDHFQIFDATGSPIPQAGMIDQTTQTSRQIQLAVKLTF